MILSTCPPTTMGHQEPACAQLWPGLMSQHTGRCCGHMAVRPRVLRFYFKKLQRLTALGGRTQGRMNVFPAQSRKPAAGPRVTSS